MRAIKSLEQAPLYLKMIVNYPLISRMMTLLIIKSSKTVIKSSKNVIKSFKILKLKSG